jgi:flagellar L-ring protein precursor FlgH
MYHRPNFFATLKSCRFLCWLFAIAFFGCAANFQEAKPVKASPPYLPSEEPQAKIHEGSLWRENGPLGDLFLSLKARNVGDIVTVEIVESSSASNKAATKTDRGSSLSASVENFLGYEKQFSNAKKNQFNPFGTIKGGMESAFDGSGQTERSGTLIASITATVTEILPNGNLRIVGSRHVMVNNEKQFITLSGIIRPRDISPGNVIRSTYISDAKIAYSGVGIIDDRQRPGWLASLINCIWPF